MDGFGGILRRGGTSPQDWESLSYLSRKHHRFLPGSERFETIAGEWSGFSLGAPPATSVESGVVLLADLDDEAMESIDLPPTASTEMASRELLRRFAHSGIEALGRIAGGFAIAVWNSSTRTLFLVSDQEARRRIYWFSTDDEFKFSTDLRALASVVGADIDPEGVDWFLHYGSVPAPRTVFERIRRLEPGTALSFDVSSGSWAFVGLGAKKESELLELASLRECLSAKIDALPAGRIVFRLDGADETSAIALECSRRRPDDLAAVHVHEVGAPAASRSVTEFLKVAGIRVEREVIDPHEWAQRYLGWVTDAGEPIANELMPIVQASNQRAKSIGAETIASCFGADAVFWNLSWVRAALRVNELRQGRVGIYQQFLRWRGESVSGGRSLFDQCPGYLAAERGRTAYTELALHRLASCDSPARLFSGPIDDQLPSAVTSLLYRGLVREVAAAFQAQARATSLRNREFLADADVTAWLMRHRERQKNASESFAIWRDATSAWLPAYLGPPRPQREGGVTTSPGVRNFVRCHAGLLAEGTLVKNGFLRPESLTMDKRRSGLPLSWYFRALTLDLWLSSVQTAKTDWQGRSASVNSRTEMPAPAAKRLPVPILFFADGKPDAIRETLRSLDQCDCAREFPVFAVVSPEGEKSSGARSDRLDVLRSHQGAAKLKVLELDETAGSVAQMVRAMNTALASFGKVIVLEGPVRLSSGALTFLREGLERFEGDGRAIQVAANHWIKTQKATFLPIAGELAWGTWARAWAHFDPEILGFRKFVNDPERQYRFDLNGSRPLFDMLNRHKNSGEEKTRIVWQLAIFEHDGLVLHPSTSLAHSLEDPSTQATRPCQQSFPDHVEEDRKIVEALREHFRRLHAISPRPLWRRAAGSLKRMVLRAMAEATGRRFG